MPDVDPYVGVPADPRPVGRLDHLRPWLWFAVVLLLAVSAMAIGLVEGRQDPSLLVPQEVLTGAPEDPLGVPVPEAPPAAPAPDGG